MWVGGGALLSHTPHQTQEVVQPPSQPLKVTQARQSRQKPPTRPEPTSPSCFRSRDGVFGRYCRHCPVIREYYSLARDGFRDRKHRRCSRFSRIQQAARSRTRKSRAPNSRGAAGNQMRTDMSAFNCHDVMGTGHSPGERRETRDDPNGPQLLEMFGSIWRFDPAAAVHCCTDQPRC